MLCLKLYSNNVECPKTFGQRAHIPTCPHTLWVGGRGRKAGRTYFFVLLTNSIASF